MLLLLVMVALVMSGATAIPLQTELKLVTQIGGTTAGEPGGFSGWSLRVRDGLIETNAKYPFIAYGTGWLAFAHFVLALAFIGPWRDPVKNIWVVEFGMVASALVVPFALVMGSVREIPFEWRLIDCSFGIVGIIPLWLCRRRIKKLIDANDAKRPLKVG